MEMRVIGYTYEAAYHCVDCTTERFAKFDLPDSETDCFGIPHNTTDLEGNKVRAIMDYDELYPGERCDDCFELLE